MHAAESNAHNGAPAVTTAAAAAMHPVGGHNGPDAPIPAAGLHISMDSCHLHPAEAGPSQSSATTLSSMGPRPGSTCC